MQEPTPANICCVCNLPIDPSSALPALPIPEPKEYVIPVNPAVKTTKAHKRKTTEPPDESSENPVHTGNSCNKRAVPVPKKRTAKKVKLLESNSTSQPPKSRKMNGYMLFSKEQHKAMEDSPVREAFTDKTKRIANLWKCLDEAMKLQYKVRAEELSQVPLANPTPAP